MPGCKEVLIEAMAKADDAQIAALEAMLKQSPTKHLVAANLQHGRAYSLKDSKRRSGKAGRIGDVLII